MSPERQGVEGSGAIVPAARHPHSDGRQEGDGASDSFPELCTLVETSCEDNDLTSLTWLQDRNLLKGINLQSGDSLSPDGDKCFAFDENGSVDDSAKPVGGAISPTSDYADSTSSGGGSCQSPCSPATVEGSNGGQLLLVSQSNPSSPVVTRLKVQRPSHEKHAGRTNGNQPYDPQVHTSSKPPFSFSCLIFMAIEDSPKKALPVKEIYAWILDHFPYFKDAPTGWKNSVRHNLSLNKCFKKVEKAPNLGKGSLWMVDDIFRPNLLQAVRKAPYHLHSQFEQVSMVTKRLHLKSDPNVPCDDYDVLSGAKSNCNVPDPELFPLLSRRLAAAAASDPSRVLADVSCRRRKYPERESWDSKASNDSSEDVDAAAAMLVLKHGPHILLAGKDGWKSEDEDVSKDSLKATCCEQETSGNTLKTSQLLPVITSSPSEDHTYSAGRQVGLPAPSPAWASSVSRVGQCLPFSSSPDEAFSEGSLASEFEDSVMMQASSDAGVQDEGSDVEERRKIVEGADALLNLAGISTKRRRREQPGGGGGRAVANGRQLGGQQRAEEESKSRGGDDGNRLSRAKAGWGGHSGAGASKRVGRTMRPTDKKKQVRRSGGKIFKMKR